MAKESSGLEIEEQEVEVQERRKGGRPKGSMDSPETVLRRETKQHIGLMKRLRDLVETQVEEIGEDLQDKSMAVLQRVEITERLAGMLSVVGKAVESIGKIEKGGLFGDRSTEEALTLDDVMNEFEGRKSTHVKR